MKKLIVVLITLLSSLAFAEDTKPSTVDFFLADASCTLTRTDTLTVSKVTITDVSKLTVTGCSIGEKKCVMVHTMTGKMVSSEVVYFPQSGGIVVIYAPLQVFFVNFKSRVFVSSMQSADVKGILQMSCIGTVTPSPRMNKSDKKQNTNPTNLPKGPKETI